jgi:hypothetical protein
MADNITLNAGSGGATLATDDIGGLHYQIVKQSFGDLDAVTLVSTSNPLPVDLRTNNLGGNINVNIAASAVTQGVSGTVTANAGSGTFTTAPTATVVDDAAFSPGTTPVLMLGATFDDVSPDSVNEGDAGAIRMSGNRNLYVQLRDAAGNERGLNIDADGLIGVTDGGGSLTIDNSTLAVTGGGTEGAALRVTIATDSTGVLSVDDNGGSLTVDGSVTVSGTVTVGSFTGGAITEVQGDVAHDAVAAGNPVLLGAYASAAAPSDVSADADAVRLWALRNGSQVINVAAGGTLITGDGANGLDVDVTRVSGTVTISGSVSLSAAIPAGNNNIGDVDVVTLPNVTIGAMANLTESLVDDAAFSPATSRVLPAGFTFDDVSPDSVNEGDIGAARMSANRNIYTTIRDAAGNERGVNVDATNRLSVSVDNTPTVTIGTLPNEGQQTMANSISVAVASDQSALTVAQSTASSLNAQVVGNVAHDGADSGNPVKIGGVARTSNPTAVAASDRVDIFCDDLGKQVVYPIAPRDRLVVGTRISLTNTTETTLVSAGGAGVYRDLVMLMCSNESATEVRVDFRDVAAGTVMFSLDLYPDGGGAVIPFRVPWPQATANSAWTAQLSASVSTVYISALAVENN